MNSNPSVGAGFITNDQYISVSPDSSRVVYITEPYTFDATLKTVPITGGTPVELHPDDWEAIEFAFADDGNTVIFIARDRQQNPGTYELYLNSIDGLSGVTQISHTGTDSGSVFLGFPKDIRVDQDGTKIIFAEKVNSISADKFYAYSLQSNLTEELNIPPVNISGRSLWFVFDTVSDNFHFLLGDGPGTEREQAVYRYDLGNNVLPVQINASIPTNRRLAFAVHDFDSMGVTYTVASNTYSGAGELSDQKLYYAPPGSDRGILVNQSFSGGGHSVNSNFGYFFYFVDNGNKIIYQYKPDASDSGFQLFSAQLGEFDNSMCFPIITPTARVSAICL